MKPDASVPITAQLIDCYFPTVDGVVRTVHNYAKNLNKLSYSCVIAPDQRSGYKDDFSYDVFRAKSIWSPAKEYRLPNAKHTKAIMEALDTKGIQILHAHSPFLLGHFALREGHKRGMKVVATFHSKYYDDAMQVTHSKFLARIVVRYIVSFYNKCDSVWTCSNGTATTLRTYGYKGDIFVIDNGTDYVYPDNPEAIRKAGREKYGFRDGVPTILFVGHQIWQKNLKLVLDTAKELENRNFDFQLMIVGSGYAAKEIQEYAHSLSFSEGHVQFSHGSLEKSELMELELASDLFFFPSIYDNSPLVLREASAMKLPALLMKDSNAAEPTLDGYNAFHCSNNATETANRIQSIFSNPQKMKEVAENAYYTLGKSWDELIPLVVQKYNEILSK